MTAARRRANLLAKLAGIALLTVFGGSCAKESITAPSGSTLTLSTPTRSVSVNGTAVLTAELRGNGGLPAVGASISFTTTLGTIDPAEIVTNSAGQATVVFSAGAASGTALIIASSGNVRASPVSLVVGTAAVGRVALTASPASVPFGGGSTTITAVVTDASGNPLRVMPVGFSTTSGTVTPTNAKTDTNGIVQTTLTTTTAATVTAVAGAVPPDPPNPAVGTLTGSVTVPVAPRPSPVVSIMASPNAVAGTPVTFTIGAMPAPGTNTTIQNVSVNFGDGERVDLGAVSGAAIVVQHVYNEGGTYTVSMTATDSGGGTSTASTVLAVKAATPLTVSVVAGPMVPTGGGPNAIVTLTATVLPASAVIASYLWDFGDGGGVQRTANNQVQHVFAKPGLYTVTVTATEALTDRTGEGSVPVSTTSAMPTVSLTASANPVAGRAMTFTIAAAVAAGSNVTMENVRVIFGDGSPPVDLGAVVGAGLSAGHVYASAGTYLARVIAQDSVRGTATAAIQVVVVAPTAPSVSVAVTGSPVAGAPTTFTVNAAAAAGSGSTIQNVQVTFGDGTAPVDLGAVNGATTTQHVYAASGNYTVTATATDSAGVTATASVQVVVAVPGAPSVAVTASANPIAGNPVTFTITAAPAAGSNTTITNVRVNFGDGTAPVDLGAVSSPATAQHVFTAAGNYTVSAMATASNNATATASTQVVVAAAPANVPSVSLTASPNPVAGMTTSFTITAAPAPGSNTTIQKVVVSFGDGSVVDLGAVSSPATTQHVYTAAGSYTVTATATASNSATAAASTQVVVAAAPANVPTVSVIASPNPVAGIATSFTITAAPAPGSNTTIQRVVVAFGDGAVVDLGAVSSPATTQHVFAAAGNYTVTATATASNNATAAASTQVVVAAPGAPSVSVTASANPVAGTPTTFTITSAPSPGSNTTITNVQVNFGDGTAPVNLGAVSSPATTQHVFAAAGNFTVSAMATASNNATATASVQVVVAAPGAPSVSVTASANPIAGSAVTFTVTAAPAPGSNTTITSVVLTFGDGAAPVNLGAVSSPTTTQHAYAAAGTYTVSATATSSGSLTTTASIQVVVAARPTPSVSITPSANPIVGRAVTFTIKVAPAPNSTDTIKNVTVNFGDFNSIDLGAVSAEATTQHVYTTAGTFTASATVTDIAGGTATANTTVVVVAPATVALSVSPNPMINTPVQFTVTVTPATGVTVQGVVLLYGDSTSDNLGTVTPAVRSHTYGTSGTFTASVTAALVGFTTPVTTSTSVVVAPCPQLTTSYTITSTVQSALHAWPGGDTVLGTSACSVTVRAPTGTISNLVGDMSPFSIVSAFGFSAANCSVTSRLPTCGGAAASVRNVINNRPYCSNAAATIFDSASTAVADVVCK